MRAGSLRHRLRIELNTPAQDPGTGEMVPSWSTFADNVPAEIIPLSGREFLMAGGVQSGVDSRITVRELAGLVPAMRAINTHDGNKIYDIKAVLPDPTRARHLTLMVQSGVSNG